MRSSVRSASPGNTRTGTKRGAPVVSQPGVRMIDFPVPTPADISAAQAEAITIAERLASEVVAVAAGERTFANTMQPLEEIADTIEKVQGRFGFMSYVAEDGDVRVAADIL